MKDQAEKLRSMAREIKTRIESEVFKGAKRTRIVTVTSGKGGVGKTNFAVNLAISLSDLGHKTILLDADMGLANVDVILGLVPRYNLYHVIRQEISLSEIIIQGPRGIQIIPGGSGIFQLANLKDYEMKDMLQQLGKLEGQSDFLIIDTGPGIAESVLSFAVMADDIIVLTTPEPTSLTDAYGIIKSAAAMEARGSYYLVVNRVFSESQGVVVGHRLKSVCEKFLGVEIEIIGFVSEDRAVRSAVMNQQALVIYAPASNAAKDIRQIAASLCEKAGMVTEQPIGIKGFFRSITNLWRQKTTV
ncbi:MAG: MinD/ParA family protein [Syntrophomonadaceae bacterium]|nr:MinD/ParA family protein [Syntrophomonadaceae bacterium]